MWSCARTWIKAALRLTRRWQMKEVAVKMFTEVTQGGKGVFSPNERPGLFRYSELRASRLVQLNNIKGKYTFLANSGEVCDFINKHTAAWANGTCRTKLSFPQSSVCRTHPGVQSSSMTHSLAGYFRNINTSARITAMYLRETEKKWDFHSLFVFLTDLFFRGETGRIKDNCLSRKCVSSF